MLLWPNSIVSRFNLVQLNYTQRGLRTGWAHLINASSLF
uniref:Uncharacterized protein n=1 Tax=Rhizophora mucronata TaxID=61149 RepID=A0A2P2P4D5_RHIMU